MSDISKRWYVVRAVSGKEKKVKELLELEISRHKLNDYVAQVLIPTEKVFQIRNGKKVNKEKIQKDKQVITNKAKIDISIEPHEIEVLKRALDKIDKFYEKNKQ